MKDLNIVEKSKRYNEALKAAIVAYKDEDKHLRATLERIFPELRESEDERLRKEIIAYLKQKETCYSGPTAFNSWITWLEKQGETYNSIKWHNSSEEPEENREILCVCADSKGCTWHEIALYHAYNKTFWDGELLVENITRWCYIDDLEKQGEQKPHDTPKFHEGEWIVHQGTGNIYQIATVIDNQYQLKYNDTYTTTQRCVDVDIDARHWTLADAKEGDVLAFDDDTIVLFKDLYNKTSFHSYCHIEEGVFTASEEDVPDWWQGKGFEPATKEQRDILMKAMADAGFTFDFKNKELRKIEPDEPDVLIEESYQQQADDIIDIITEKSTKSDEDGKIESKFHKSEWIIDKQGLIYQIENVVENVTNHIFGYDIVGGGYFNDNSDVRLWNIKDAKDGDVLAEDSCIFILKEMVNDFHAAITYCTLFNDGEFHDGETLYFDIDSTRPATKEQREKLEKAISDAGYEWDATKKVLKKIEPKFKIGDWIVSILETARIIGVNDSKYQLEYIDGKQKFLSINYVNYAYDKWSIQDAKDGDVLVTDFEEDNMIVMYHSMCTKDTINVHCCFDNKIICSNLGIFDAEDVKPATKNQRVLLFQKLKEAGYEWDAVKKELKKIEQKPAWPEKEELDKAKKDAYNQALDKIEYHSEDPSFSDGWDAAIQYLKKVNLLEK